MARKSKEKDGTLYKIGLTSGRIQLPAWWIRSLPEGTQYARVEPLPDGAVKVIPVRVES